MDQAIHNKIVSFIRGIEANLRLAFVIWHRTVRRFQQTPRGVSHLRWR